MRCKIRNSREDTQDLEIIYLIVPKYFVDDDRVGKFQLQICMPITSCYGTDLCCAKGCTCTLHYKL